MRQEATTLGPVTRHAGLGALLSLFVVHPVTMVIYWFELHPHPWQLSTALAYAFDRLAGSFELPMLPMSATFIVLGSVVGAGTGLYARALAGRTRQVRWLETELERGLSALLRAGEGERLELKTSARWDDRKGAGNRQLELVVARTVAGFLNAAGGTLLIGVDDDGSVVGLESDYHTLQSKGRDGFERFLIGLVAHRLGTDACALVHVVFHEVEGKDVCRVIVDPSPVPVFLSDGNRSHYYLRTGNATRELDVAEALRHVAQR